MCVLVIKYRYRIQEPEKAYKQCVFIETKKNLHNILGVSVLGPVGTRPDRLKPVGTRSD